MMRQYELVERVRKYNPNTDEDLLNRAYVYAMKAHGLQTRASGDPYFSHPLEVAAILTDLGLDDATINKLKASSMSVERQNGSVVIMQPEGQVVNETIDAIRSASGHIDSVIPLKRTLEDLFVEVIREGNKQ